jgi:hypothetical protein
MLSVPGRSRALQYLSEVALSADRTAEFALDALIADAQFGLDADDIAAAKQETTLLLQNLWRRGQFANASVAFTLQLFAKERDWRK